MSKKIYEIEGFDELKAKIKRLPDKVKRREIIKILRQAAKSTLNAARSTVPVSDRKPNASDKRQPGNLKKSLKIQTLRRAKNPMVIVGPASRGKNDGFYGRFWVIPGFVSRSGTKVDENPFMDEALKKSERAVAQESEKKISRYFQKQIDKL